MKHRSHRSSAPSHRGPARGPSRGLLLLAGSFGAIALTAAGYAAVADGPWGGAASDAAAARLEGGGSAEVRATESASAGSGTGGASPLADPGDVKSASPSASRSSAEPSGSDESGRSDDADGSTDASGSSGTVDEKDIPRSGPGTFTTAAGTGTRSGKGAKVLRYAVSVEDGLTLSAAATAREVEKILADPRGWTADGTSAFQRVPAGAPRDFVVKVATPGTVDTICGQYGLDTGGEVNCNVGDQVMVNLKRWLLATEFYAQDIPQYRALIINHEVGHYLGHGHQTCPGAGMPAPAMMQQIKGLRGCVINAWPYDRNGKAITGPAVP
ncbi:DUF3152 domain-containing protein [Streptomyces paludis]|uniref:DUF3152 domain-containing protein n=1 Tax=Streptomyces paludis TaxID=2282738 RepID=A0A345HI33_9ACTN|nr:DUF3152 domain-containing protein [Streptomyces paludis]AXG76357.1 DUF3152 domain-containing protein [Streptomyces paludis]